MKIEYLKEFIVLSEYLNYSNAALHLYITQPVLSRHIKELEGELGVRLFDRNKKAVKLTETGKMILDDVKDIIEHYDMLISQVHNIKLNSAGSLGIGLLYYSKDLFLSVIDNFSHKYPNCILRFIAKTPIEILQALYSDEIDICTLMHVKFVGSENLQFIDFDNEPMVLAVSNNHPLSSACNISVNKLVNERFVNVDDVFYRGYYIYVAELLKKYGVQIDENPILVKDIEALTLAVQRNQGVAILLEPAKKHIGPHAICLDIEEDISMKRCFAYKSDNQNPALKEFLRTLV